MLINLKTCSNMHEIGKEKLPDKKLTQKEISVDCCKLITKSTQRGRVNVNMRRTLPAASWFHRGLSQSCEMSRNLMDLSVFKYWQLCKVV